MRSDRHPLAVLSSYVESFFDGDYRVALSHNPILQRYVPELARLVRKKPVPNVWVRYEDLVRDPETHFRRVCEHVGVPFEERAISYGESGEAVRIAVNNWIRTSGKFVPAWASSP